MTNGVLLPASGAQDTAQETDREVVSLQPVSASERIEIMDVLRGFALIGILLMNIEWFSRPLTALMEFDETLRGIDYSAGWFVMAFVQGKFYKLFALLFGMGFAVMLLRAREAGRPIAGWFTRRMLVLYAFGLLHMIFLWTGDILHDYAFAGLLLLGWIGLLRLKRFQRFNSPGAFLKTGLAILLLPLAIAMLVGTVFGLSRDTQTMENEWEERRQVIALTEEKLADPDQVAAMRLTLENNEQDQNALQSDLTDEEKIEEAVTERFKNDLEHQDEINEEAEALAQGSYWSATQYRTKFTLGFLPLSIPMGLFQLLPLFMIGYWFVTSGVIRKPEEHGSLFKSMTAIGLGLGIFLNIGASLLIVHPAADEIVEMQAVGFSLFHFGQYLLAAGYLGLLVLLAQKPWAEKTLQWFAPMGRMALTNYILHSVILTTIFYGYAMGQFGEISRGQQMLLVVAIIAGQAALSDLWLQKFRFGPLEWLWRSLTYLKIQPMRLQSGETGNASR